MPGGRKPKLTPEVSDKFCEGIELGMTYKLACGYVGIHEATFYRWMQEAEKGRSPYSEFREALKAAESSGAAHSLAVIHRAAADGTWAAAAWLLERRHCYRRDSAPIVEAVMHQIDDHPVMVNMDSEDGRNQIIEELARLPQEVILDALNRKQTLDAK